MFEKLKRWFRINCTEERVLYRARTEERRIKVCTNPECKHIYRPRFTEFFGAVDQVGVYQCVHCGGEVEKLRMHLVYDYVEITTFDVLKSYAVHWVDMYPSFRQKGHKEGDAKYGKLEMIYMSDIFN